MELKQVCYSTRLQFEVPDNSMTPILPPGHRIQMRVAPAFEGDGIYALRFEDTFMIRLVQRVPGGLRIKPHNPTYDAFTVRDSEVTFIAKLPFRD